MKNFIETILAFIGGTIGCLVYFVITAITLAITIFVGFWILSWIF